MQAIIQRVSEAQLAINGSKQADIGRGIVALVGIETTDSESSARRLAERILAYRIFPDAGGRMNLSLADIDGDLLLIPNFTVAADTNKGTRASFTTAAAPADAERLFVYLSSCLRQKHACLQTGSFGAEMHIRLTNDGPVTFILRS